MPSDATRAAYRLGRALRYRPLPIIGQRVTIGSLAEVEPTLQRIAAPWIEAGAAWDGCDLHGGLAKYGLIDRYCAVDPRHLDHASTLVGIPALRDNGFALEPDPDPEITAMMDGCLIDLADDLDARGCLLKLFLEDGIEGRRLQLPLALPPDYFPRELTVIDACITNAGMIWFGKHFYL